MSRVGVIRFWGTNCDQDVFKALGELGLNPEWLWFADTFDIQKYTGFVLPGGFSYGDYLRPGALAARTPAMQSVREAASKGFPILGICNGFQVLCESGLLPGVLTRNEQRRFVDRWVKLNTQSGEPKWLRGGKTYRLPVAHGDGRFFANEETLKDLNEQNQIWLRYEEAPNGAVEKIAGVLNRDKNVAALMPHPERAVAEWMGGADGRQILAGLQ